MARRRRMLGSVNLLGLNEFGQNPGMSPIWGVVIGGGVAGTTTAILRRATSTAHPELIGFGAGLAVSGAMFAMPSTRHAALSAALSAFFASGLSFLERTLLGTATVAVPGAAVGFPNLRALNGLGMPSIRPLNGLGVPQINQVHAPVGVAGNQLSHGGLSAPPVSLLGAQTSQAASLRAGGGPQVHGLSAAYGATLMGGGR